MSDNLESITIVGGGFTGACAAIQLSRYSHTPRAITILDPQGQTGRGLAYSTSHPDHRLNGPDFVHVVYPDDNLHFSRWLRSSGRLAKDPQACVSNGWIYARRRDFGDYIQAQLSEHIRKSPSGSTITVVSERATSIARDENQLQITTSGGHQLTTSQCWVATGHEPSALPSTLAPLQSDPRVIHHPFTSSAFANADLDAHVVVLGNGLTAADILTSLVTRKHRGRITVVSRRGRSPSRYHLPTPTPKDTPGAQDTIWQVLTNDNPQFLMRHGRLNRVRDLLAALRRDIANADTHWSEPFDELRNSAHALWPSLSPTEKRRFFRHLKRPYDVHRYRYPPPIEPMLDDAYANKRIEHLHGKLTLSSHNASNIALVVQHGDHSRNLEANLLVNCTGPNPRVEQTTSPFLRSLLDQRLASPSPTGVGFAVDEYGHSLDHLGERVPGVLLLGPVVHGELGEVVNVPFIARQIDCLLNL